MKRLLVFLVVLTFNLQPSTFNFLYGETMEAYYFSVVGLTREERVMVETLQGIVNRKGPRLYLHTMQEDKKWQEIYQETRGFVFKPIDTMDELLQKFKPDIAGLVLYDLKLDATKWVAATLGGLENLLPVTDDIIEKKTSGFRIGREWAGTNFSTVDDWQCCAGATFTTDGKVATLKEGNPDAPWAFVALQNLTLDLDNFPFLEISVPECSGEWGIKFTYDFNKDGITWGGPDDDVVFPFSGKTGKFKFDVKKLTELEGKVVPVVLQLHIGGEGEFVSFDGLYPCSASGEYPKITGEGKKKSLLNDGFIVKENLKGRWNNNIEPYRWALKELMPKCSKKVAHSVGATYGDVKIGGGPYQGFDYSVMQKGFVFNLSPSPEQKPSYGGVIVGGDPEQAELYNKIMEALQPPAQVNGYGEPEDIFCSALSKHGNFSFHAYNNWSFHTNIKPLKKELKQKFQFTTANTKLEKKFYISFMTSEGDTMKPIMPFAYGAWFHPLRGKVPINWGVNPIMAEQFPAMLEYFYDNASINDYFFAGCSGAGYVYPNDLPDISQFAAHTGRLMKLADIPVVDIWTGDKSGILEKYGEVARPEGFTYSGGPTRIRILPGGIPVIYHELPYWQAIAASELTKGKTVWGWREFFNDKRNKQKAIDWLIKKIEDIAARQDPPFFIPVYGDLHNFPEGPEVYNEVMNRLDPEKFKFVRLDEMISACKLANIGRVLVRCPSALFLLKGVSSLCDIPVQNTSGEKKKVKIEIKDPSITQSQPEKEFSLKPWEESDIRISLKAENEKGTVNISVSYDGKKEERTISFRTVDIKGVDRGVFRKAYPATGLQHRSGEAVGDRESIEGSAWLAKQGEASHIVFGPYEKLPDGNYVACFRLKVEETADEPVCTIDVFYGAGTQRTSAEMTVRGSDFQKSGKYQWFALPFGWVSNEGLAEYRIFWTGRIPLYVDHIVLFSIQ